MVRDDDVAAPVQLKRAPCMNACQINCAFVSKNPEGDCRSPHKDQEADSNSSTDSKYLKMPSPALKLKRSKAIQMKKSSSIENQVNNLIRSMTISSASKRISNETNLTKLSKQQNVSENEDESSLKATSMSNSSLASSMDSDERLRLFEEKALEKETILKKMAA